MAKIEGAGKVGAAELGFGFVKIAVGEYDFAVDGGAVSTINLRGDKLPNGARVIDCLLVVDTALAGGTATDTLSLGAESTTDLQAAAARNGAPWSTTGSKRVSLTATSAPAVLTAERSIRFVINATALTSGKFRALVSYVELA